MGRAYLGADAKNVLSEMTWFAELLSLKGVVFGACLSHLD